MKIKLSNGTILDTESTSSNKPDVAMGEPSRSSINESMQRYAMRNAEIQKNIASRGTVGENLNKIYKPGIGDKVFGILNTLDAPRQMLEAGIANPLLAMQNPEQNIQGNAAMMLAREAAAGFTGKKLGQFGDVYYGGLPISREIAGIAGLVPGMMGTARIVDAATRPFRTISKMSDRGILNAGKSLVKAADNASEITGSSVSKMYEPFNSTSVDGLKFIDSIKELPDVLVKEIESSFGGKIEDIAQSMNIENLRKIKQLVAKYQPSAFGKETLGLAENINADKLNKVYSNLQKLRTETLDSLGNKKISEELNKADDLHTEVVRASNYLKKTVTDSTLKKPTKAGKVAGGLKVEGDVTSRMALNDIAKVSSKTRQEIDRAVRILNKFNAFQEGATLAKKAAGAAIFGGAIGAIGGRAINNRKGNQ